MVVAVAKCRPMPKPHVSLRVNVPLPLFERLGEYRHAGRHDSKNQALVALLAAGLAALSKPVELPSLGTTETLVPKARPARNGSSAPKLIRAASDDNLPGRRPNGVDADA